MLETKARLGCLKKTEKGSQSGEPLEPPELSYSFWQSPKLTLNANLKSN